MAVDPKVRFAPSPTGFLHVGNIRLALINFLFAKKTGGTFILRFDDTDLQRTKDEYRQQIIEDLTWLGIEFVGPLKQSDRLDRYEEVKQLLMKSSRIYECWESEDELEIKRKTAISRGVPPIYDRASLKTTEEQKQGYIKEGRKPHYRFKLNDGKIAWQDIIKEEVSFQGENLSDPVVMRGDGSPLYTFCSVVDDIDMDITHIFRGEDHITNTAIQIQIFEAINDALGKKEAKLPEFGHFGLIESTAGKISKRIGGFDIKALRENGVESLTISNIFSRIGSSSDYTGDPMSLEQLVAEFDLEKFSKSGAKFCFEDIYNLNGKVLQRYSFAESMENHPELKGKITEAVYELCKANIDNVTKLLEWEEIVTKKSDNKFYNEFTEDDKKFLKAFAEGFKNGNTKEEFDAAISAVKGQFPDRKGKQIFMPIRFAISGREDGPHLFELVSAIGCEEARKRIEKCCA